MVLCIAAIVNVQFIWHNMPMNSLNDKKALLAVAEVLNYFDVFSYAPTTDQIHRFISYRISKEDLKGCLESMENHGKISSKKLKHTGERIWFWTTAKSQYAKRVANYEETQKKLKNTRLFFTILAYVPFIDFVGISGSCAMFNAKEMDDIDVFIISAPGGMWIARLFAIMVAKCLNFHRKRGMIDTSNTICLNLFFDGAHVEIPKYKRNLYTAHEIAQIIPMMVRGRVYDNFLDRNKWFTQYFPNIVIPHVQVDNTKEKPSAIVRIANAVAKRIQISRVLHNKTTEEISDQQLWFFPDDFQKKLEKHIDIHRKQR